MEKFEKILEKVAHVTEMVVAIVLVIFVVIGLVKTVEYVEPMISSDISDFYEIFQAFLGHALTLVVGLEFVLMILNTSSAALVELVLFVIARKMLIYSHSMFDLVLGTVALLIVFIIIRYFLPESLEGVSLLNRVKNRKDSDFELEDKGEENEDFDQ